MSNANTTGRSSNAAIGSAAATDPAAMSETQQLSLMQRLDALEAKLKETQAENERLKAEAEQSMAAGLRYSPNERAFAGSEGYKFLVKPIVLPVDKDKYAHLKPVEVSACDESEAKRWYYQSNETRPGSGQALDPMQVRLEVTCLSIKERNESLRRQYQLAGIRNKVDNGQSLNKDEERLLREYESALFANL